MNWSSNLKQFIILLVAFFPLISCDKSVEDASKNGAKKKNSVTIEEEQYLSLVAPTTKIGDQSWLYKNLDLDTFQNGEKIPQSLSQKEWKEASDQQKPCWAYYGFSKSPKSEGQTKLYNWYATSKMFRIGDSQQIGDNVLPVNCSNFYQKLPSSQDYEKLISFLGDDAGEKLKKHHPWGDNKAVDYDFNAVKTGFINSKGECFSEDYNTIFWTRENIDNKYSNGVFITEDSKQVSFQKINKGFGCAIRSIKK